MPAIDKSRVREYARNLASVLRQAGSLDIAIGRTWYDDARDYARTLASEYSLTLEQSARVIAVLSPNCAWMRNKVDARNICEAYRRRVPVNRAYATTYHRNVVKAYAILAGNLEALRGPKVSAFAACIAHPYTRRVCVDFHVLGCARATRYTTDNTPHFSLSEYETISQAIRLVARRYSLRPYQCQAIIWVTWRRLGNSTLDQLSLGLTR